MSHYVAKCKHGTVISQCRCMGPKETRIVPCPLDHETWAPMTLVHEAPTDIAQPPAEPAGVAHAEPGLGDYAARDERMKIVEFIRQQANFARETIAQSRESAFHVVAAYLVDVAVMVERGDHIQ